MSIPLSKPEEQKQNGPTNHSSKEAVSWIPDTTSGSLLHRLVKYDATTRRRPAILKTYLLSIVITYGPLLVAAIISPLPLWRTTADLKLPFFSDWNMTFTFLVSFPTLVVFLVTDDYELFNSQRDVQTARVLCVNETYSSKLANSSAAGFGMINISSTAGFCMINISSTAGFCMINIIVQSLGALLGLTLGWLTVEIYTLPSVGFWISSKGDLLPVGYAYDYCIFLLYAIITIYVSRGIAFSVFLSKVADQSTIRMLPSHPDKCGGLKHIGKLGLRNQYILSILGLNIVILAAVSLSLKLPSFHRLIAPAAAVYFILGPILFLAPLLPFRRGMNRTKEEWMREVAERLRMEFERLRLKIQAAKITKEDEEVVDRLRKIGSVIDELPVWPFDARTLRNFASAYLGPLVPLGFPFIGKALVAIIGWLNGKGPTIPP
jgi:hypothetical protein